MQTTLPLLMRPLHQLSLHKSKVLHAHVLHVGTTPRGISTIVTFMVMRHIRALHAGLCLLTRSSTRNRTDRPHLTQHHLADQKQTSDT